MNQFNVVSPEIFLLAAACLVSLVGLRTSEGSMRLTHWVAQGSLLVVAAMHFAALKLGTSVYVMQGMVVADPVGHLLAMAAAGTMMLTLAYAQPYLASRDMLKGEFFALAMFVLLGISVMVSANNFLTLYVGLEVMSLSLYALAALRRDHAVATEAAMKYFVLGALASGFLLYGISMMYGATGSLEIPKVAAAIHGGHINPQVLTFGVVFIVAGLMFKLGLVPFHMWVPDVYQGSPTAVTLLISGAPKFAAFGIAYRVLDEGLAGLATDWQEMLIFVSVASMAIGNLAAIAQTNLKRMLAYSAIGQLGFMVLGFTPAVVWDNTYSAGNGLASSMFYVITYVITTLGTFGLIMLMSRPGFEAEELSDYAGLSKRSPWLAGVMSLFMFSLAGLPPLVGFYSKFMVLQSIVTTAKPGYITLAVVAVLMSLVAAFYYLRVVKVMYFDEPKDATRIEAGTGSKALLAINGFAMIALGLLPDGLMRLCVDAIRAALAS